MPNTTSRIFAICASLCVIFLTIATGYISYRAVVQSVNEMPANIQSPENETVARAARTPKADPPAKPSLAKKSGSKAKPSISLPSLPTRRDATRSVDSKPTRTKPAEVKQKPGMMTAPDVGPASNQKSNPFPDTVTEEYENPLMFFPDDVKNRIWWEIADVARQTRDKTWSLSISSANSVAMKYNVNATAIYHFFQMGAKADWLQER